MRHFPTINPGFLLFARRIIGHTTSTKRVERERERDSQDIKLNHVNSIHGGVKFTLNAMVNLLHPFINIFALQACLLSKEGSTRRPQLINCAAESTAVQYTSCNKIVVVPARTSSHDDTVSSFALSPCDRELVHFLSVKPCPSLKPWCWLPVLR